MKTIFQSWYYILLAVLFMPQFSYAHPHSWIDIKTEIVGKDNQILGFNMQWTFDAMTSSYMLDGHDLAPEEKEKSLQFIADSILENIFAQDYFTFFYNSNKTVLTDKAINAKLIQDKARLTLVFYLPLAEPQRAIDAAFKLHIFEPSYYVGMSWKQKSDISFSKDFITHCNIELNEPTPTVEQMDFAFSLPTDAKPNNSLGQLFNQTVKVNC
jgi:tRNA threonylcarbamoyladenosine biosynthesis protein TsaE